MHLAIALVLSMAVLPALAQGLQPLRQAPPAQVLPPQRPQAVMPAPPAVPAQPTPEILAPPPAPLQEGAWTYQAQEEGGQRLCVLAGRAQDGTFLVLRVIQNYGPDLTLVQPSWRLQGDRLRMRVSIGAVAKDFAAIAPAPQQLRADLVADAEAFADLLEAAETLDAPPVQAAVSGLRPVVFPGAGLRAVAARFGDCIDTLHGRPAQPAPAPMPVPDPRR